MLAAITAQWWMYTCGPGEECVELSLAALEGGDLIAADNGLLTTCAITNLVYADRGEALDWWEVARTDAHRRGSLFAISAVNLWLGFTQYWRGDLEEAERLLRTALGELEGVDSLTPSELRVAKLASEGHTNRDIAQELFVTPKTVERHLGHAYRKLGVRSRHELESVLDGK
jgi:DNA-binding CsgD family transcriptional regulator